MSFRNAPGRSLLPRPVPHPFPVVQDAQQRHNTHFEIHRRIGTWPTQDIPPGGDRSPYTWPSVSPPSCQFQKIPQQLIFHSQPFYFLLFVLARRLAVFSWTAFGTWHFSWLYFCLLMVMSGHPIDDLFLLQPKIICYLLSRFSCPPHFYNLCLY